MRAQILRDESQPTFNVAEIVHRLQQDFAVVAATPGEETMPARQRQKLKPEDLNWTKLEIQTKDGLVTGILRDRSLFLDAPLNLEIKTWGRVLAFFRSLSGRLKLLNVITRKLAKGEQDYDPQVILKELKRQFPQLTMKTGDQIALQVERLEKTDLVIKPEVKEKMLAALKRNAAAYGPAFSVSILVPAGPITGTVRRRDMSFISEFDPEDECWLSIIKFCSHQRGDWSL